MNFPLTSSVNPKHCTFSDTHNMFQSVLQLLQLIQLVLLSVCWNGVVAAEIKPFEIHIADSVLQDLQLRLNNTRFPDALIDSKDWNDGTDLNYMKELVEYWKNSYDWRKEEAKLNKFHHYTVDIDGLNIHFIHEKSKDPNAFPLIFSHGWPGSIVECRKIIPLLTEAKDNMQSFHVVCPSLPGYGFSSHPTESGWNVSRIATVFAKLMQILGYKEYIAQGGDWGAFISTHMALVDPEHCKAIHLNMIPPVSPFKKDEEDWNNLMWTLYEYGWKGNGYMHIQATKPQTIGYALNDSPAGLAAYIIEKWMAWSDCGGNIENRFSKDELLTNVMIYWSTESITSSMRLYMNELASAIFQEGFYVNQPTAVCNFPKDIMRVTIRSWLDMYFNVVQFTKMEKGGHFASLEEPELLVADIRAFFTKVQSQLKDNTRSEL